MPNGSTRQFFHCMIQNAFSDVRELCTEERYEQIVGLMVKNRIIMNSSYSYYIRYIGNMGNCMLQVMIARALMNFLGEGRILTVDQRVLDRLVGWNLPIELVSELPAERIVINRRIRHMKATARSIKADGRRAIEIATCNLFISQYPPAAQTRSLFQGPPDLDVPQFGPDYLVINVRAGKILGGIHRDYVVPPISFYRYLVAETGLKPVFTGEVARDIYSQAIRDAFPDAIYVPSVSPIADFETVRRASNIAMSVSSFSMLAAWLSDAQRIFMPLLGGFNPFQRSDGDNRPLQDPRYRFFLFPIFYMQPIELIFDRLESCLGSWREVSGPMLQALINSAPRVKPTLAQGLAVFDPSFYAQRYPDIQASSLAPEAHFREFGHAEGRAPCAVDETWYALTYPLAANEVGNGEFASMSDHYAAVGVTRGFRPRP